MNALYAQINRVSEAIRKDSAFIFARRNLQLPEKFPLVSFTFDDFPRSALTNGGKILKKYGLEGTYYVAPMLANEVNIQGEHFDQDDLQALLSDGHELGSHTYSHLSIHSNVLDDYVADVRMANAFVQKITGNDSKVNFAYPFGHVSLAGKSRIGQIQSSCRSTFDGINYGTIDLNILRANPLYGARGNFENVEELIRMNAKNGGWLIFYTHDVREEPSPYGCSITFFEQVVKRTIESRTRIMTVAAAIKEIESYAFPTT